MPESEQAEFRPHDIVWDDTKTQRLWDYYSTSLEHVSAYFGETIGPHFARVILRKGLLRRAKVIVDFSCGTGAIIDAMLRLTKGNASVSGYDLSELSVNRTIQRNQGKLGFTGAWKLSDLPSDIPDSSVDLLILTEVIEHLDIETRVNVLKECYRILTLGGKLVVTTPNDEILGRSFVRCPECGCTFHRWQHVSSFNSKQLSAALLEIGFRSPMVQRITWGNELIEIAFKITRAKPTGLIAIATKE